jgi:hypothetical protein
MPEAVRSAQPYASRMENWQGCETPDMAVARGSFVILEPWQRARHKETLWECIPLSPLEFADRLKDVLTAVKGSGDWQTLVLCKPVSGDALGMASFMRIRPEAGSADQ